MDRQRIHAVIPNESVCLLSSVAWACRCTRGSDIEWQCIQVMKSEQQGWVSGREPSYPRPPTVQQSAHDGQSPMAACSSSSSSPFRSEYSDSRHESCTHGRTGRPRVPVGPAFPSASASRRARAGRSPSERGRPAASDRLTARQPLTNLSPTPDLTSATLACSCRPSCTSLAFCCRLG